MKQINIHKVKELPQQYQLLTDSQDILANLEYIFGIKGRQLLDTYSAIFVWGENGDIIHCFGCETNIPHDETLLDQLR